MTLLARDLPLEPRPPELEPETEFDDDPLLGGIVSKGPNTFGSVTQAALEEVSQSSVRLKPADLDRERFARLSCNMRVAWRNEGGRLSSFCRGIVNGLDGNTGCAVEVPTVAGEAGEAGEAGIWTGDLDNAEAGECSVAVVYALIPVELEELEVGLPPMDRGGVCGKGYPSTGGVGE